LTTSRNKPITYVAFLRGINIGGHKPIKMEALKEAFALLGFQNIKTVLASGNVIFQNGARSPIAVQKIEQVLKEKLGHEIRIILRTLTEIQRLADSEPFKQVKITPSTRRYVTFLSSKRTGGSEGSHRTPEKDVDIAYFSETEVCSVVVFSHTRQTSRMMYTLEKEFGRDITTRNWNTIRKILNG